MKTRIRNGIGRRDGERAEVAAVARERMMLDASMKRRVFVVQDALKCSSA